MTDTNRPLRGANGEVPNVDKVVAMWDELRAYAEAAAVEWAKNPEIGKTVAPHYREVVRMMDHLESNRPVFGTSSERNALIEALLRQCTTEDPGPELDAINNTDAGGNALIVMDEGDFATQVYAIVGDDNEQPFGYRAEWGSGRVINQASALALIPAESRLDKGHSPDDGCIVMDSTTVVTVNGERWWPLSEVEDGEVFTTGDGVEFRVDEIFHLPGRISHLKLKEAGG